MTLRLTNLAPAGRSWLDAGPTPLDRRLVDSPASSYTFDDVQFGIPQANRIVVIGVSVSKASALVITNVTIGGETAASVASVDGDTGTGAHLVALYRAALLTEGSGTVVVTLNTTADRCAILSFALTTSLITHTDSDGATGNDLTLTVPIGGGLIAFAAAYNVGEGGGAWDPGIMQKSIVGLNAAGTFYFMGGSLYLPNATDITFSSTFDGSETNAAVVGAAWGP